LRQIWPTILPFKIWESFSISQNDTYGKRNNTRDPLPINLSRNEREHIYLASLNLFFHLALILRS
jgi:hypothetical protein